MPVAVHVGSDVLAGSIFLSSALHAIVRISVQMATEALDARLETSL